MKLVRAVLDRLTRAIVTSVAASVMLLVGGSIAVSLLIGLLAFFAKLSAEGTGEYAPLRLDLVVDWLKWCYSSPQCWIIAIVGAVIGFGIGVLPYNKDAIKPK